MSTPKKKSKRDTKWAQAAKKALGGAKGDARKKLVVKLKKQAASKGYAASTVEKWATSKKASKKKPPTDGKSNRYAHFDLEAASNSSSLDTLTDRALRTMASKLGLAATSEMRGLDRGQLLKLVSERATEKHSNLFRR